MIPHSNTVWVSAQHMVDNLLARLPSLAVAIVVFLIFYFVSVLLSRIFLRPTKRNRRNLGVVFARIAGAAVVLLGLLVGFSVVAPSFQAADFIKNLEFTTLALEFAF